MDLSAKRTVTSVIEILIVIFLLMVIASFATPFLLQINNLSKVNGNIFFINRLFVWVVLILLWLYLRYSAHQKLLIWTETKRTILFYFLSTIIILIVLFIGNIIITKALFSFMHNEVSKKFLGYIEILKTNIPLLIFTAFTAAIVEELIFRGFIQTRLDYIFKSPVSGILISSILFAAVHLSYGTLSNVIAPFFIGLVFSFFYWKYRNIKILILCHFLWDLFGLFISIQPHSQ